MVGVGLGLGRQKIEDDQVALHECGCSSTLCFGAPLVTAIALYCCATSGRGNLLVFEGIIYLVLLSLTTFAHGTVTLCFLAAMLPCVV